MSRPRIDALLLEQEGLTEVTRNSIQALDYFIPWALKKGYVFLPLDMTSPVVHSLVKN